MNVRGWSISQRKRFVKSDGEVFDFFKNTNKGEHLLIFIGNSTWKEV
jgi:hypothetical protein